MIDQIEARLGVVRMTDRDRAEALGLDFDRAPAVLAAAPASVGDGARLRAAGGRQAGPAVVSATVAPEDDRSGL